VCVVWCGCGCGCLRACMLTHAAAAGHNGWGSLASVRGLCQGDTHTRVHTHIHGACKRITSEPFYVWVCVCVTAMQGPGNGLGPSPPPCIPVRAPGTTHLHSSIPSYPVSKAQSGHTMHGARHHPLAQPHVQLSSLKSPVRSCHAWRPSPPTCTAPFPAIQYQSPVRSCHAWRQSPPTCTAPCPAVQYEEPSQVMPCMAPVTTHLHSPMSSCPV